MRWFRRAGLVVLAAVVSCSDPISPERQGQPVFLVDDCQLYLRAQADQASLYGTPDDCGDPGGGGQPQPIPGLPLSVTWSTCTAATAANDSDRDGVTDYCEQEVASAFGPYMNQQTSEFWSGGGMIPGEYYHGVNQLGGSTQTLRVVYLPAYFFDDGSWLPGDGAEAGDGEFFVVDVIFSDHTRRWYTVRAHMSQHGDWPFYQPWQLEYWENRYQGTPLVYVSDRKHANYPTDHQCDIGAYHTDECEDDRVFVKYPVDTAFNIGSYIVPRPPEKARRYHLYITFDAEATEDMWSHYFCGWQGCISPGGFRDVLDNYGFGGPYVIPPPNGPCEIDPNSGCLAPERRIGPSKNGAQPVAGLSVRRR